MPRTQITFGTCNLYNLNLPGLPIYHDTDGWTEEEYQKKVAWLSAQIKSRPADVWGFQELWHTQALLDVFQAAGLHEQYTLLAPPGHAGGRIVCGAAVRNEIVHGNPTWIKDFPPQFKLTSQGDDPQTSQISVQLSTFSRAHSS